MVLIALFIVRFASTRPDYSDEQVVKVTGRVMSEPIRYSSSQRITLHALRFYLPLFPQVNYGDFIIVEGVVNGSEIKKPILIDHKTNNLFLFNIRKSMVEFYERALPEPHSSLVSGVVLGSKASIPQDFWDALRVTGTAHVVVASGMNVTLVAGFLMTLLVLVMSRKRAIYLALVGVWAYALVSGFDAPIIRAAIMGSLAFTAQALGRMKVAWRALFLSALVMLIIWPNWVYDLGFILSFVATASLMLFESKIRGLIRFVPGIFREGLSTSLSAQIGVAPILLIAFNQYSLLSPIVNALVLWTIPPMTVIGMVAGLIGIILFKAGQILLFLVYPLTSWFIWIVELFSNL